MTLTKQQQLNYLHQIQKLQQINVIKDDLHLTYQYRNRNKATNNIHTLQDKIHDEIANNVLDGGYVSTVEIDSILQEHNVTQTVDEIINETLINERKRIHHDESRYVDHAVEKHINKYSQFLDNRIRIEANRLVDKVIIIEGKAIENGATPAEARQQVQEYLKSHGKARTRNIIKDAIHSQESNISFINALNEEWRYKVWMNGRSKSGVREWHKAVKIAPVPIDEPFEIYGPYGRKESMFPGDLNSGAENVANCKCWLRYTNHRPKGLGGTYTIPESSYLNKDTRTINVRLREGLQGASEKIVSTAKNVQTKIKDVSSSIRNRFKLR